MLDFEFFSTQILTSGTILEEWKQLPEFLVSINGAESGARKKAKWTNDLILLCLQPCSSIKKVTPAQVFSFEFGEIFQSANLLKKKLFHRCFLVTFERCFSLELLLLKNVYEHVYMRPKVNSNRFESSNRFKNLFCSYGYLPSSACYFFKAVQLCC